ncbi:hypothetical protein C772_02350 [Bhargavaea cecembensis DSE10]|uniref:Protein-glutamine gamma-glutamyltransferase-like C-terminal domain-containing protein n=1 Tax=Bhargavaea cecembensis DSE10 TaxID=1235279 RepID=M7P582_9BACL|nr:DUF4129 domain-containing protein [Bhargavaea cecembensis]EMR05684.1 hypothetical protein C772_02350 [Bhargavaea cecembensis DSE10]
MRDRKMEAVKLATLLLEVSVIYVLAAPPYLMEGVLPPVLPHLLAVLAGTAAARLLSGNAGMAVTSLLALFAAWATGLPFIHTAVLAAWIGWRMKSFAEREPAGTEWLAVFISIAYSLCAFMMMLPGEAGQVIYLLIVCQLVFAVLLRNARMLYRQPARSKAQDLAFLRLAGGLLGITALLVFGKPVVAWAGGFAGMSFGAAFYTLITRLTAPAWVPLEMFFGRVFRSGDTDAIKSEEVSGEEMPVMEVAEGIQWGPAAMGAVLLLLGGAVLISIFRSRYKKGQDQLFVRTVGEAEEIRPDKTPPTGRDQSLGFLRHQVRREVYRFGRRMRRAGFGRSPEETFREWLERLGLEPEKRNRLNRLYTRVRYAEEEVSMDEAEWFRRTIRSIRPPSGE